MSLSITPLSLSILFLHGSQPQSISVRTSVTLVSDALGLLLALLVDLHMPMQGGGVSPTVHVLVHLLGDLLRVPEVRCRHCHSEKSPQSQLLHIK